MQHLTPGEAPRLSVYISQGGLPEFPGQISPELRTEGTGKPPLSLELKAILFSVPLFFNNEGRSQLDCSGGDIPCTGVPGFHIQSIFSWVFSHALVTHVLTLGHRTSVIVALVLWDCCLDFPLSLWSPISSFAFQDLSLCCSLSHDCLLPELISFCSAHFCSWFSL